MSSTFFNLPPSNEQRIAQLELVAKDTQKCFEALRDNVMTKHTTFTYQKKDAEMPVSVGLIFDEIFERLEKIEEALDSLKDK